MGLFILKVTGPIQNPQSNVMTFTHSGKESGAYLQTEGNAPFTFFIP
jgi:hypothetical protein